MPGWHWGWWNQIWRDLWLRWTVPPNPLSVVAAQPPRQLIHFTFKLIDQIKQRLRDKQEQDDARKQEQDDAKKDDEAKRS